MQWTAGPWESMISSWGSWGVPGGWIPVGHPWSPPGISLSSWLDFRGVPLSHWTQSSWNSFRLRQRSIKRIGDLQAFLVSKECLVIGPAYSHVFLRPRPGYLPKVPTMPFRDQVVNLQALPSEEADPALCLPRRSAEREGCLQAEVGPLDSGCHRLSVLISRRAVPPGGEGSLHSEWWIMRSYGFALQWWEGCMAFVCHAWHLSVTRSLVSICIPQVCDGVLVVAFSIGPLCHHDITRSDRQIGNVSVTYVTLVPRWREWRHYFPMPQSRTIAGCLGLVLGSLAENLMSGCTCQYFIPVRTVVQVCKIHLLIFIGVFF